MLPSMTEANTHAQSKDAESSQLLQQSLQEENSQLVSQVKQLVSGDGTPVLLVLIPFLFVAC